MTPQMRKFLVWGSLIVLILILYFYSKNSYNNLVALDENVTAQGHQVEVAYQARLDKTKNLFEIVLSSADFEKSTLTGIIEARSKASSVQINADNLTPEKIAEFEKAQNAFGQSLGRLLAISENYPQLKSTEAFRDFQTQYEGIENRIANERRKFNEAAQDLNTTIRSFPQNIWASMAHIEKRAYFESKAGAEDAPDIGKLRKEN